ncbi:protein SOGA3a isoform X1 [Morone saxatilis]|uniref:protein SOGA3a isoform X1 n=1 Tax=Morone saxatilis TaxID=34816 RepID=UPI0015E23340|nr:protein SOGA3a isoform X1 [Morone saxatilis]
MWSAFMNGSGLHGGGGAGGGYVPSQGWEFVPCSRMDRADRGRGKSRSPLRRISSPPTVFSQLYEPQFGASPAGGGEGGAGTQLEVLRGQMWPGPEPQQQQQQQTQHMRLKKKFEDLKKRHVQDKEGWMREKESLLRQVADIQGGENRRILLDLKTVLEEVQAEVKREEEKRSELQLQYTRDRCAWELEKAELKCRIAQLEAREGAGLVQSAAGPGSVASRSTREQHSETSTLRQEREEQRRLLADTHSTAMDLRCRLEHNERDWSREKAELLERFDVERREWESQLKDMQKKIEELYCEVRAKREGTGPDSGRQDISDVVHRLSIRSTSTGSSLLSENSRSEPLSSSSQSEPIRHSPLPGFGRSRNISGRGCVSTDCHHSACFQADSPCEFNAGGRFTQNDHSQPELVDELISRGTWQQDTVSDSREAADTAELDAFFHGASGTPQKNVSQDNEKNVHVSSRESPLWSEQSYSSDKKKNTTALNAALKEIARVSEELCSYQDEIRKKSGDWRTRSESLCLPEESEILFGHDKIRPEVHDSPCDLSQIYDDLRALERENWITLSPDNTWQANREPSTSCSANTTGPDSYRDTQTTPGVLSENDTAAPPIPPRMSSWNLSAPTYPDTELHIPESPMSTVRKCHSPCVLVDRKCSSPSIVRKFGAMLQENEGKVLIDGVVASCAVPANTKCNIGCCHNRWSCDASKFTNSKLSTHDNVQKSFSEVNILTAGKDLRSDHSPVVGNSKELQIPTIVKELPVDLLLSSLEISPPSPKLQGSKRNIMLEQKTAEFNRTLFQAEMGHGVEEQDAFTDACSVGCQPVFSATCASDEVLPPRETTFQLHCSDVTTSIMGVHPEVVQSLPTMDSTVHKVQPRRMRCGPEGQEVRINLSSEQSLIGLREATTITSQSPAHHSEAKHKVRTASSPSRKTQHRAATEALFLEPIWPDNTLPGQNVDSSSPENESLSGAKPQPARVGVSLQQPSAENKQRPTRQAQPKHVAVPPSQSDSSRPGPRVMNDHPWKHLTLAAYPRPEGSRSNYGAVERILKNYESASRAQQHQSQRGEMSSSPNISVRQEETITELDMLDMGPLPLPPTLRHTQTSYTQHAQLSSSHSAMGVKEIHLTVQENEESFVSSSSIQKNFSRPARPANRRLPSRWASRSPTSSSSASSSPSTTPVVPPSLPLQKHTSSFSYSQAFHIETVII